MASYTVKKGCTCGQHEAHEVARRCTADGCTVVLWSDGMLTWRLGFAIRGLGRARSNYARGFNLRAGWLVLADVELFDSAEVLALVRAARKGLAQPNATTDSAIAFMRQAMNASTPARAPADKVGTRVDSRSMDERKVR